MLKALTMVLVRRRMVVLARTAETSCRNRRMGKYISREANCLLAALKSIEVSEDEVREYSNHD